MKIIRNPEFLAPVKVLVPADGGSAEQSFRIRFRALTLSEQADFDHSTVEGTNAFLRTVIVGWEGLQGEDGTPFEVSAPNLNMILDLQYIRLAIVRAYFDATNGIGAAKRGN